MANFYATYSPSAASGAVVTANQGTSPWIVAGNGVAGTAATGVLTVQGIAGGTAVPISGSITASNPSVAPTGAAVPADATYIGMTIAGTLTGLVGTANGLKTDGSAVTQPISAVSLPLPTGASTALKQPALGTAGTASADVITVQGITSMTPLLVNGSGSTQPVSGTVAVSNFPATQPVSGTVAATQSGTWNIGTVTTVTGVTTVSAVTAITNALPAGSNIIGNVRIDQTTPGTTNGVVVNSLPAQTVSTATFQAEGAVAFGSITNSYVTLLTPSAATKILFMRNNTNAAIAVSMDAGSTTNFVLDSGDQVAIDFQANALVSSTSAIQVKYAVGAPTSGSMRINACH